MIPELTEGQRKAAREFASFYPDAAFGIAERLDALVAADIEARKQGVTGSAAQEVANHFLTWRRGFSVPQLGQLRLPDPHSENGLLVSPIRPRSRFNDHR